MLNLSQVVSRVAGKPSGASLPEQEAKFADAKNKKFSLESKAHVQAAAAYVSMPKVAARYNARDREALWTNIRQAAKRFGITISETSARVTTEGLAILETWWKADRAAEMAGKPLHSFRTTRDQGHYHFVEVDVDGNGETDSSWSATEDDMFEFVQEKYHYHKVSGHQVSESDGHTHRIVMPVAMEARLSENIQEAIGTKGNGIDAIHIRIREAIDGGQAYNVTVIQAGLSYNRNLYPESVLESSVSMLNATELKAYVDHSKMPVASRPPGEIAGGFRQGKFAWNAAEKCIDGQFVPTLPWLKEALQNAEAGGVPFVYQVSIDANVAFVVENYTDGKPCRRMLSFQKYNSADIVDNASAGGKVRGSVKEDKDMTFEEYVQSLTAEQVTALLQKRPDLHASVRESITEPKPEVKPDVKPEIKTDPAADGGSVKETNYAQLAEQVRRTTNELYLAKTLTQSPLPKLYQDKIEEALADDLGEDNTRFKRRVKVLVESYQGIAAAHVQDETNKKVNGVTQPVVYGFQCEANVDKIQLAVDGYFSQKDEKLPDGTTVPRYRSLREMYFELTGDRKFRGRLGESCLLRLVEAADTNTFQKILGDSIRRRMQKDFVTAPVTWKKIVSSYRDNMDFRVQRTEVLGGYPALSTVAQGGTYQLITSPGDVELTWSISKRGNLERITEEAIRNDDLKGLVRKIPQRLALSAAHQLDQYVWKTLLIDNPNYGPDGLAIFHASHSNQTTDAVSQSSLNAGRASMRKAQPYGQTIVYSDNLPRYFAGPPDLEALIVSLCTQKVSVIAPGSTSDNLGVNIHTNLEPIILPFLTDTNNAYLIADPEKVEVIEMGFLDGIQEPELWEQGAQTANGTVGTWFDSDQLTWKIRFVYGGVLQEYRSVYRFNP